MTVVRALWVLMAFLVLAGFLALSMWGIPAPTSRVEKQIPNDALAQ